LHGNRGGGRSGDMAQPPRAKKETHSIKTEEPRKWGHRKSYRQKKRLGHPSGGVVARKKTTGRSQRMVVQKKVEKDTWTGGKHIAPELTEIGMTFPSCSRVKTKKGKGGKINEKGGESGPPKKG